MSSTSVRGPSPFYVSGQSENGSASFGSPAEDLREAREICQVRHAQGFRRLRVFHQPTKMLYKFHVKSGLIRIGPSMAATWPVARTLAEE